MKLSEKIRILRGRILAGILLGEYYTLYNGAVRLEQELQIWRNAFVWRPPNRPNITVVEGTRGLEIWEGGQLRLTIP